MSSSSAEVLQPMSDQSPHHSSTSPQDPVHAAKPAWGGTGMVSQPSIATSPWGAASAPSPDSISPPSASFRDLMSEDLAKDIQDKENESYLRALVGSDVESINLQDYKLEDTSDDLFLAQMLQYEFDREYDQQVNREEKHFNKNSKVSVSFDKFKICPSWYGPESDDDFPEIDEENRDFDSFEARKRKDPVIPPCGYVKMGKNFVTKHDLKISGRKNAERIMNLPPGINTGDGGGFDMQLSNKVFNKLHRSAMNDIRRKNRVHDKVEKATAEMALDPNTRLLIFKWVNNAVLDSVNGIISSGKEAVVFHAQGGEYEDRTLPDECAVKVFKTTLTDFKTRERYIKEDYRFKDRMSKHNTQKSIRLWAEKEYHNLRRLQRAGIPSPEPLLIKKHLLLMSFIGKDHRAAPKLKEAHLSFSELCVAYEEIVEAMMKMFHGCHLVHADLSEYNILWHEGKCWIIDVGQAVEPMHPHALHFLHRDCTNIIKFFHSKGLPELPSPLQLFEKVSGISLPGPEEAASRLIEEYEVHQELWREGMSTLGDQFEFLWQEIQAEEKRQKTSQKKDEDDDEDEDLIVDFREEGGREDFEETEPDEDQHVDNSSHSKRRNSKGRSSEGDGGGPILKKDVKSTEYDDCGEQKSNSGKAKVTFNEGPSDSSNSKEPVISSNEINIKSQSKQGKRKKGKNKKNKS